MPKLAALALASFAALGAAAAPAAGQVAERDPDAESPSGHVYQLPVDSARDDAAPKRPAGGARPGPGDSRATPGRAGEDGGAAPGGAAPPADGAPPGGGAAGSGGTDGSAPAGGTDRPPSAIRSENGFGTSARVPGVDAPAGAQRPAAEPPSDPSGARVLGLLALGVLLAAGVGLASRSARRPA